MAEQFENVTFAESSEILGCERGAQRPRSHPKISSILLEM